MIRLSLRTFDIKKSGLLYFILISCYILTHLTEILLVNFFRFKINMNWEKELKEVIGRITDPANNLLLAETDPAKNLL